MRRRDFALGLGAAAMAGPLVARGETALPVIGFLHAGSREPYAHLVAAFLRGLKETAFVPGETVAIEYRWAESDYGLLPGMAAELLARGVSVIHATSYAVNAAKAATTSVPIVFNTGTDPVKTGLVPSLNHPGGNITGVSWFAVDLEAKHIEQLHELFPAAASIGILVNAESTARREYYRPFLESAARAVGVQAVLASAARESEIEGAFASLARAKVGAVLVATDFLFLSYRDRIAAVAARHGLATISGLREFADAGGFISYGANLAEAYRQSGRYVGRILKGEKPGELPVIQATTFELVINLKAAKTLGIEIPGAFLARADEVIE